MIPWAAPGAQYRARKHDIQAALTRVLDSGSYVLGDEVAAFERAFAGYCGCAHAVGVGSGTDALILALRALDVGPGDEVVTVSHTAVATVAAVLATGATPVLVDVDPAYYTLDPVAVEASITPRTRAMVAVHLYGQTADMAGLGVIARRRGLRVVEDCAQAAGGTYHGRRLGSLGDVACFSFYPTKNLGAVGDGGMVTTQDVVLADRVRRLRQYGWDEQRTTREIGVNSRLDPLQAAVLGAKLDHLDADNGRRAAIARMYDQGLAGLPLTAPAVRPQCTHAYHLYVVQSDDRGALASHLKECGIGTAVHYPLPVHRQQGYAERVIVPRDGLPATDWLVERIVTLPLYPELTDADVERIVAAIRAYYRS